MDLEVRAGDAREEKEGWNRVGLRSSRPAEVGKKRLNGQEVKEQGGGRGVGAVVSLSAAASSAQRIMMIRLAARMAQVHLSPP